MPIGAADLIGLISVVRDQFLERCLGFRMTADSASASARLQRNRVVLIQLSFVRAHVDEGVDKKCEYSVDSKLLEADNSPPMHSR
jgi:hypothetical protein